MRASSTSSADAIESRMLFFTLGFSLIIYTSSSFIILKIVGSVMSLILVLVAWSIMGCQGYLWVWIDWYRHLVMLQRQIVSRNAALGV